MDDCHTTILSIICFRDNIQSFFLSFFFLHLYGKKKTRLQIIFLQYVNSTNCFFPQLLLQCPSIWLFQKQYGVAKNICITCKEPLISVLVLHCQASAFSFLKEADYSFKILNISPRFNILWFFEWYVLLFFSWWFWSVILATVWLYCFSLCSHLSWIWHLTQLSWWLH